MKLASKISAAFKSAGAEDQLPKRTVHKEHPFEPKDLTVPFGSEGRDYYNISTSNKGGQGVKLTLTNIPRDANPNGPMNLWAALLAADRPETAEAVAGVRDYRELQDIAKRSSEQLHGGDPWYPNKMFSERPQLAAGVIWDWMVSHERTLELLMKEKRRRNGGKPGNIIFTSLKILEPNGKEICRQETVYNDGEPRKIDVVYIGREVEADQSQRWYVSTLFHMYTLLKSCKTSEDVLKRRELFLSRYEKNVTDVSPEETEAAESSVESEIPLQEGQEVSENSPDLNVEEGSVDAVEDAESPASAVE